MHFIIVGSGVAAVAVATEILNNPNHTITMPEAGPSVQMDNYRAWLDLQMGGKIPYQHCEDQQGVTQVSQRSVGQLKGSRLIMTGGSTNHWGGWALRFQPEDFALHSRTGYGRDWPLSVEEFTPYYEQAERFLKVTGSVYETGQFALPYSQKDQRLIPSLAKHHIAYQPMPMARNVERCQTTGTCKYCPFGARFSAALALIQLQRLHPERLTLLVEHPVLSLLPGSARKIRGVLALARAKRKCSSGIT